MTDPGRGRGDPQSADASAVDPSRGVAPAGESVEGWPAELAGVTETVTATHGPNGSWNHAALGLDAGETPLRGSYAVTARTFGRTRTRRNLEDRGEGYVQFTRDPVDFVEAALGIHETAGPILERTDAWARAEAEAVDRWDESGTEVVEWRLTPVQAAVRRRSVPTIERGFAAVVEATVVASRLEVDAYDEGVLLDRLAWLESVVETAGSERHRAAFERIDELVGWRSD